MEARKSKCQGSKKKSCECKESSYKWPKEGPGQIWTKDNVPAGELPPPLKCLFTEANIIQVGAGSGGCYSAALLAKNSPLKILVLDEGSTIDYNEEKFLPGNENEAYFQTDVEKSAFPKFDFPGGYIALGSAKQIAWNVIRGGAMRLSHFAIEAGSSTIAQREMFQALGNDPQWDVNYLWGHFMDNAFRFFGPHVEPNHANLGKIWAVESKPSPYQDAWFADASNVTGLPVVGDFNTLTGSLHTIGAEPSNVRPDPPLDGTRSTTENEYLIPEISVNNNIVLVRDVKIPRILFDRNTESGVPRAIGVEGLFHNRNFKVFLKCGDRNKIKPGNHKSISKHYRDIISTLGTVYNPYVLMLSGLGPQNILNKYGIPVIKINENLGRHLKECSSSHMLFTIDATRADIGYYAGVPPSPIVQSRPGAFVNVDGAEMFLLATPLDFGFSRVIFAISFELEQEREGYVELTSTNFGDDPQLYYNWNEDTLQKHVNVFKLYREIVLSGGVLQTQFHAKESQPGSKVTTDADLRNFAKSFMQPVNHLSCTTRMALDESDGVVDTHFKVFGVDNLRLASQSVLRFAPGAGGQFWCMAIAWNLNNTIRSELGLPIF